MNSYNNRTLTPKTKIGPLFISYVIIFWLVSAIGFYYYHYAFGQLMSVVAVLVFLFLSSEQKFLFIISGMPFTPLLKISPGLPTTFIVLYMIICIQYMSQRKFSYTSSDILSFLILMILQVGSIIVYKNSYLNIINFTLMIVLTKVCSYFFESIEDKKTFYNKIAIMFTIAILLDIVISLLLPDLPQIYAERKYQAMLFAGRFAALNVDPNLFSQFVLCGIGLLIGLIHNLRDSASSIRKIIMVSCIIILSVAGLFTLSKSYYVAIAVLILLYGLYYIRMNKLSGSSFFILLFTVLAFTLVLLYLVLPLIASRMSTSYNDVLTGRGNIWRKYIYYVLSKMNILFFGCGFMNSTNVYAVYTGRGSATHNMYLEFLSELGIVGLSMLAIFFGNIVKTFAKTFKNMENLFIIVLFITGVAIATSSVDLLYVMLPVIVLTKDSSNRKEKIYDQQNKNDIANVFH